MTQRNIIFLHCILLLGFSAFILSLHLPALVDYPNHLARMYIYDNLESSPQLKNFYYKKFEFAPYLGMDLFFKLFLNFFDVYTAGKLLISISISLFVFGVLFLSKTLYGKYQETTFLIYTAIFSNCLFWGFLNYILCISFVIVGFSLWLKLQDNWYKRFVILYIFSQFLFFVHIFGFLFLMLIIGIHELQKDNFGILKNKKTILPQIYFLLACFMVPIFVSIKTTTSLDIGIPKFTKFGDISDRIYAIISTFNFGNPLIAMVLIGLLGILYWNKTLQLQKNKFLIASCVFIALIIPQTTHGIFGTHVRFPIIIVAIIFASTSFARRKTAEAYISTYVLVIFTTYLIIFNCLELYRADKYTAKYIASLKYVDSGSKILTIHNEKNGIDDIGLRFNHLPSVASIEIAAFVPTLINAIPPIRTKAAFLPISTISGRALFSNEFTISEDKPIQVQKEIGNLFYWQNWPQDFDYIDYFHYGHKLSLGKRVDGLKIVYQDNFHTIYKIKP